MFSTPPSSCRRLIALEMAKIHTIHANGSLPKPVLWQKMQSYFTLVKNEINPRYEALVGSEAAAVSAALTCWPYPAHPCGRLRDTGPGVRGAKSLSCSPCSGPGY